MKFTTRYNYFDGDWSIKTETRSKDGFATERDAVEWLIEAINDDSGYAEFVMKRSEGERIIGNGDQLLTVMESGDYWDEYVDEVMDKGAV